AAAAAEPGGFVHAAGHVETLAAAQLRDSSAFLNRVEGFVQLDFLRDPGDTSGVNAIAATRLEVAITVGDEAEAREVAELLRINLPTGQGRGGAAWRKDGAPGGGAQARTWSQTGSFHAQVYRVAGITYARAAATAVAVSYASTDHDRPEVATRGTAYSASGMAQPDQ